MLDKHAPGGLTPALPTCHTEGALAPRPGHPDPRQRAPWPQTVGTLNPRTGHPDTQTVGTKGNGPCTGRVEENGPPSLGGHLPQESYGHDTAVVRPHIPV